jgi:DNA repair exonuclease SbcCD ATPase subunit
MKRMSFLLLCAVCQGALLMPVRAQDEAARAAAVADREAAEERYRRLNATVDNLLTAQAEQQRRLDALAEELRKVAAEGASARAATSRAEGNYATRDELNQLVETIRKLDAKREADKKQILEEIANLDKSLRDSLAPAPRPNREPPPSEKPEKKNSSIPADQEGVWYVVEKDNTLTAIIAAHNKEFKKQGRKTSLKLVLDANPKIEPKSLNVGQKIFIPMVAE